MEKQIKKIRKTGYNGSILQCVCGWIGKATDSIKVNGELSACPKCKKAVSHTPQILKS